MPAGRPTKYSKEWLEGHRPQMLKLAKDKAATIDQLNKLMGISKRTSQEYRKKYPDFLALIDDCLDLARAKWDEISFKYATGEQRGGSAEMIKFRMVNTHGSDYKTNKDQTEVQQETKLDVQGAQDILAGISVDDLKALIAQKEAEQDDGK